MSGIAGIYHTDGRSVDRGALRRLLDAQSHRGPDGEGRWDGSSIALGHLALHTTPEAGREDQPLTTGSENIVLTADARIDNRSELIAKLEERADTDPPPTDATLILWAYRQWGVQCPTHLRGAFAFVIWDARKQQLFCARDRMGLRPFHYCWSEPHFVFGSEINGVLSHPAVSHEINETRVADFLVRIHLSTEYTFYKDVSRLPPGHRAVINREGMCTSAYWTLSLPDERTLESEEAYAEAFRNVFSSAVEDRLRAQGEVGTFLSGGLDSSSVTVTAHEASSRPLHTFSALYDQTPAVDEREYIRAVLDQGKYRAHFVAGNDHDLLSDFPDHLASQQKAPLTHTPSLMQLLYRKVQETGLNVVLDGHGGDEVASRGHGYPGQLAHERKWGALLQELRGRSQNAQLSWPMAFLVYWLRHGPLPGRVGRGMLRVLHAILGDAPPVPPRLIDKDLARRTNVQDRKKQHREQSLSTSDTERQYHVRQVGHTVQPGALEELNQMASAHSVEPRFPFWDRRVVEFCLSLPSRVKRRRGVGRQILRSGLSPLLPDRIRTRTKKTEFRRGVVYALTHSSSDVRTAVTEMSDALAPYLDMDTVHSTVGRFLRRPFDVPPADIVAVLQVLRLGYFLLSSPSKR